MVLTKSDCKTLNKGDVAPDFSLKNVDGSMFSLSSLRGNPIVIIFMCNHCPYVKPKMDEISAIQRDYRSKGVAVVCINSNDTTNYPEDGFENMQKLAQEKGYQFYLLDETQEVAVAYGATCTPDPFVFDSEHRLVYHGRINNAMEPSDKPTKHDMREVLDNMLAGKEVKDWFRPSMGCNIKWKE